MGALAVFMAVLLGSTYELGRRLDRPSTGLAAALLLGMYPIVYGLSRIYLLDVPLAAMVALAVCCLVAADRFRRLGASLLFGLAVGLGMLTKWTFVLFVAAPFVLAVAGMLAEYSPRSLRNALLAVLVGGLVSAPWYFVQLASLGSFLQSGSVYAVKEGDPLVRSWQAWTYYARALASDHIFLPFVGLFVLGLVLLLVKHKLGRSVVLLVSWILMPYLVLSSFPNKNIRYTVPYLPAVALITALGLAQIRKAKVAGAIWGVMAVYACVQFAGLSFGLSDRLGGAIVPASVSLRLGASHLVVYTESVHTASPPHAEDWRVQEILEDVLRDSDVFSRGDRPIRLVVLPNRPFFEPQGFRFHAELARLPMQVSFVTGVGATDGAGLLQGSDYVVAKTGDLGPAWSLQEAAELTQALQDPASDLGRQFVQIGEYTLPDGSEALLYRHQRG